MNGCAGMLITTVVGGLDTGSLELAKPVERSLMHLRNHAVVAAGLGRVKTK